MQTVIGIILIIAALFLVVAVLMQSGKSKNLSGTIAGAAETFFGKSKVTTIDKKLSKLTTIVAIVFVVLVLVSYLMQDTIDVNEALSSALSSTVTDTVDETVAEGEEAVAESGDIDIEVSEEAAGE